MDVLFLTFKLVCRRNIRTPCQERSVLITFLAESISGADSALFMDSYFCFLFEIAPVNLQDEQQVDLNVFIVYIKAREKMDPWKKLD